MTKNNGPLTIRKRCRRCNQKSVVLLKCRICGQRLCPDCLVDDPGDEICPACSEHERKLLAEQNTLLAILRAARRYRNVVRHRCANDTTKRLDHLSEYELIEYTYKLKEKLFALIDEFDEQCQATQNSNKTPASDS